MGFKEKFKLLMGKSTFLTFAVEGEEVDGETVLRLRNQLEDTIIDEMRGDGFVPIISDPPVLFWEWNKERQVFVFKIAINGRFVGKRKSQDIQGYIEENPTYFAR